MLCLLAILLTAIAAAAPVAVEVQLHEHEAALIEVRTATGATVFDARVMDGSARDGFGWLPDLSEESGTVRATLPALFVEEGEYRLHIQTPDGTATRSVAVSPSFTRQIPVRVPSGATAVRGVRDRGGPPAVVWVPTDDRTDIVLPIGDGEWSLWADNAPGLTGRVNPIQTGPVLMTERPRVWPRTPSTTLGWVVAGLLLPVTILLGAAGIWGLNRLRQSRGFIVASLTACALSTWITADTATSPTTGLLMSEAGFTDPPNSATLAAATADALHSLSDVSTTFSFPEGHSWLLLGPSWLSYVMVAPVSWFSNGIAAHNLGQWACLALLALAGWALARHHNVSPASALLASVGAVLAPSLLGELDAMSLDRAALFGVPIFVLTLDLAIERGTARWMFFAGASLASVLYAQTYYGLYLAAAAPLMVLPRLFAARPDLRLARALGVAGFAIALMVPWGLAAKTGLSQTQYLPDDPLPAASLTDIVRPFSDDELAAFVDSFDPRVGGGDPNRPMDSATDRLLSAVINSNHPSDMTRPGAALAGGAAYWALWLGALILARRRRGVLIGGWDTAVLLLMSLGPFLRTATASVGTALPYYVWFLSVPGFDQLKHPQRYVYLAAAISSVPLAIGWDGLLHRWRLRGGRGSWHLTRWVRVGLTLAAGGMLAAGAIRRADETPSRAGVAVPFTRGALVAQLDLDMPVVRQLPVPAALDNLPPAAALVLPLENPLPTEAYLGPVQAGLRMVNAPPHGAAAGGTGLPSWAETNGLLNKLAYLSGSTIPRRQMGDPSLADRVELDLAGLRYVILYRQLLPAAGLLGPLERWLDDNLQRIADDGDVAVWELQ